MQIIFLSPSFNKRAGGTRIILQYAHLLQKKGHDVTVLVRSSNRLRRIIANILQLKKPDIIKDFQPRVRRVADFSQNTIPDHDAIIVSSWQHIKDIKNFIDNKKLFYILQHDERMYHGDNTSVSSTYGLSSHKIVVSTWLQEMLEREYGQSSDLLLNPIDRELFYPTVSKKDDNVVRIMMQHHIYDWKGIDDGMKAIHTLRKKYDNLQIVMFGARQKDLPYNDVEYHFDPPQEEIRDIYSSCDIFICPSWDEGFGLPSVEAMSCRCALVTYANGGSRDFAFHEKTALVAERKNVDDLTLQIEKLILDPKLRERISQSGYEYVKQMPTWSDQVNLLENILLQSIE